MEFEDQGEDETITAYHEAGHCVMAVVCGGTIHRATITPADEHYFGSVEIHWSEPPTDEVGMLVALAGPVAEMIYRGEPLHPAFVPEWAVDWKIAWKIAGRTIVDQVERLRWMEQLVAKLHQALNREANWAAIAAVSDQLLAHDEIAQDEIVYEVSNWLM